VVTYKITDLKHSQLPISILQKNFNAIMEEQKTVPDWLTTGIIYLLPKSENSKEVRNYRPIMCLTTMCKTLTGITAKKVSTHLEE
jgi:hypothetical protein